MTANAKPASNSQKGRRCGRPDDFGKSIATPMDQSLDEIFDDANGDLAVGGFPEAIEAGKRAVALRPNDQIGWTSLSLFYNRNGDIKEAEAAGAKAKILSWGGKIAKE